MPLEWRKWRPLAISRTIKLASRSVKRPRFIIWLSNGPERVKMNAIRETRVDNEQLTAFHFLEDQIEVIIVFEKIDDAQNVFTTTTMIIDIDLFEYTRSVGVTRFANNLDREKSFGCLSFFLSVFENILCNFVSFSSLLFCRCNPQWMSGAVRSFSWWVLLFDRSAN